MSNRQKTTTAATRPDTSLGTETSSRQGRGGALNADNSRWRSNQVGQVMIPPVSSEMDVLFAPAVALSGGGKAHNECVRRD